MGKRRTIIIGEKIDKEKIKKKIKESQAKKIRPPKEEILEKEPDLALQQTKKEKIIQTTEKKEEKTKKEEKLPKKKKIVGCIKRRGKNYKKAEALIEKGKVYQLEEALFILKKIAFSKFDETVELHLRLGVNPKKTEETIRGVVFLPYGRGKKIKIASIVSSGKEKEAQKAGSDIYGSDDLIEKIKKGFLDFDVLVATPDMMSKLGEVAKILGPKGLMPNPKSGTVGMEIKKMIEEIKKGKIEIKMDKDGNLHIPVGKISFETDKLKENFSSLMETIFSLKPEKFKGEYIKSATLKTTMSPPIKINFTSFLKK